MKKRLISFALMIVMITVLLSGLTLGVGAVDYSLPSLWQEYEDYFIMGTFGNWNGQQALYHYRTNSPANALKLDSQIGSGANNNSRNTYVAAVAAINADETLTDEEKAAKIEEANRNVVLATNPSSLTTLNQIRAWNAANPDQEPKVVRAHVLVWHGGQQPNYFFCNGFVYNASNPDWASPETMLARLDNYIKLMMERYVPYNDIIYSWDVVNEGLDDYTGQVRNADDYQVGQWGNIFRRRDLDNDPDARLYAESVFIREAFASARKWSDHYGADWKLYYNDFQDSNKLYEPKMSQTIKMLKPIYEAGNIDGYGMQGRLSWAYPSIDLLEQQIQLGLTVADEISISEGDIRSDFEPNPDYDPDQPTRRVTADDPSWPTFGSGSWANIRSANGNTFDVFNSPVRRITGWGTGSSPTLANSEEIMKKQADFAADWMDLLIKYSDKVVAYQWDGTSDSSTFNSTTGCHIWNNAGNEKMSFFAVIGAPNRDKLKKAIESGPDESDKAKYSPKSWAAYKDALEVAQSLTDVRIYDMAGVNNVKNATAALNQAIEELVPPAKMTITAGDKTQAILQLKKGDTAVLKANIEPMQAVTWKSSNASVVSVDPQTGILEAKKTGIIAITATADDGTSFTISVRVT